MTDSSVSHGDDNASHGSRRSHAYKAKHAAETQQKQAGSSLPLSPVPVHDGVEQPPAVLQQRFLATSVAPHPGGFRQFIVDLRRATEGTAWTAVRVCEARLAGAADGLPDRGSDADQWASSMEYQQLQANEDVPLLSHAVHDAKPRPPQPLQLSDVYIGARVRLVARRQCCYDAKEPGDQHDALHRIDMTVELVACGQQSRPCSQQHEKADHGGNKRNIMWLVGLASLLVAVLLVGLRSTSQCAVPGHDSAELPPACECPDVRDSCWPWLVPLPDWTSWLFHHRDAPSSSTSESRVPALVPAPVAFAYLGPKNAQHPLMRNCLAYLGQELGQATYELDERGDPVAGAPQPRNKIDIIFFFVAGANGDRPDGGWRADVFQNMQDKFGDIVVFTWLTAHGPVNSAETVEEHVRTAAVKSRWNTHKLSLQFHHTDQIFHTPKEDAWNREQLTDLHDAIRQDSQTAEPHGQP